MQITQCDKKGRIYLKQTLRTRYGSRFVVVEAPQELLLMPLPEDAVEELGEMGRKLQRVSLKQLRRRILQRARQEVRG